MACSSGCPTPGVHESFGACLRSKHLHVEGVEAHQHNQSVRSQQAAYAEARRAGLQPDTVFKKDVDRAWRLTDQTGVAYRGDRK
jgi:hypothetical protein